MFQQFLITGFSPRMYRMSNGSEIIPSGQLKFQARKASRQLPDANDQVGPVIRFEWYGRIVEKPLTRYEVVFGKKARDIGKSGGFAGLVVWAGYEGSDLQPEVRIDMVRARLVGASDWIVQFVRRIILAAGWTIISEGVVNASRYLREGEKGGEMMKEISKEELIKLLPRLSDRERVILEHRFGLYDGRRWTLVEVGKKINLSRERVRQIEKEALFRLQLMSRGLS